MGPVLASFPAPNTVRAQPAPAQPAPAQPALTPVVSAAIQAAVLQALSACGVLVGNGPTVPVPPQPVQRPPQALGQLASRPTRPPIAAHPSAPVTGSAAHTPAPPPLHPFVAERFCLTEEKGRVAIKEAFAISFNRLFASFWRGGQAILDIADGRPSGARYLPFCVKCQTRFSTLKERHQHVLLIHFPKEERLSREELLRDESDAWQSLVSLSSRQLSVFAAHAALEGQRRQDEVPPLVFEDVVEVTPPPSRARSSPRAPCPPVVHPRESSPDFPSGSPDHKRVARGASGPSSDRSLRSFYLPFFTSARQESPGQLRLILPDDCRVGESLELAAVVLGVRPWHLGLYKGSGAPVGLMDPLSSVALDCYIAFTVPGGTSVRACSPGSVVVDTVTGLLALPDSFATPPDASACDFLSSFASFTQLPARFLRVSTTSVRGKPLAIDPDEPSHPILTGRGIVVSYLPWFDTANIDDHGWSTAHIRNLLVRGCVERNPGPSSTGEEDEPPDSSSVLGAIPLARRLIFACLWFTGLFSILCCVAHYGVLVSSHLCRMTVFSLFLGWFLLSSFLVSTSLRLPPRRSFFLSWGLLSCFLASTSLGHPPHPLFSGTCCSLSRSWFPPFSHGCRLVGFRSRRHVTTVIRSLLLLSGVEPNPGPTSPPPETGPQPTRDSWKCPVPSCPSSQALYRSSKMQAVKSHILTHFSSAEADQVPSLVAVFDGSLRDLNYRVCPCGHLCSFSHFSGHTGSCAVFRQHSVFVGGTPAQDPLLEIPSPSALPTLAQVLRLRRPVAEHIPTAVRMQVASVASALHMEAATANSAPAFTRLMMFPKLVLGLDPKASYLSGELVRQRLAKWESGPQGVLDLWCQAKLCESELKRRPRGGGSCPRKPRNGQRSPNPSRAEEMARSGAYGKALQACLSRGTAENSPETINTLRSLHPDATSSFIGTAPVSRFTPSKEKVRDAVLSFGPGSAAGASGWRASHLKVLLLVDSSGRFLDALTALVQLLARGQALQAVRPLLGGATLIALNKKDGGIRPIAIGETHRRLTSKVILSSLPSAARKAVGPRQFGAGAPAGTERVVHLLRRLVGASRGRPDFVVLKVDIQNAFNSLSRAELLKAVFTHAPDLAPWALWLYGSPSSLLFDDTDIASACGVQQGDPLGPYLFSLAIAPVIAELEGLGLEANLWYLDDGVLAGPAERVHAAFSLLQDRFAALGLTVKIPKCEYVSFSPDAVCPFPRMKHLYGNFSILGTPIGSDDYVTSYCDEKVLAKARDVCHALKRIADPQVRYNVLRQCVAFGPMVFLMRTVPPVQLAPSAYKYDAIIREAFSDILGPAPTILTDNAWSQATFSVKAGGLGLRSAANHRHAAFLGSCHSASSFDSWDTASDSDYSKAQQEWSNGFPSCSVVGNESQKQLSGHVDNEAFWQLYRKFPDKRNKGRLRAVNGHDAGVFFNCMPCKALHLDVPPAHFRIIVRWWLGMNLYPSTHSCPRCGHSCDLQGYHSLTCKYGGDLGVRHNALRNVVLLAAHGAALGPRAEQAVIPGSQTRPADLLFTAGSRTTVCDFAVTHPLQDNFVDALICPRRKAPASYAADKYAEKKDAMYKQSVEDAGYTFSPCVVDSFGNWGTAAHGVLHSVAQATHFRDGRPTEYHLKLLIQKCAVVLAWSNAQALLGRCDHTLVVPDGLPSDFDYSEDASLPAAFQSTNQLAAGEEQRGAVS